MKVFSFTLSMKNDRNEYFSRLVNYLNYMHACFEKIVLKLTATYLIFPYPNKLSRKGAN